MGTLPSDYLDLLGRLGRVCTSYRASTGFMPVLVGGGAAAIMTAGSFMSGDLDIVASDANAFDSAMHEHGFRRETRFGRLLGGYYHPSFPRYGVELVSGHLFDGRSDRDRQLSIVVEGADEIRLPSPEDLIADRLGQHAVASKADESRLLQAQAIYDLAPRIDLDYLRRRVIEDGGDIDLLDLGDGKGQ